MRDQEQLVDRFVTLAFEISIEPKATSLEAVVEGAMATLARKCQTSAQNLAAKIRTRNQWNTLSFEPGGYEGVVSELAAGNVARARRLAADNKLRVRHWREACLYGHLLFSKSNAVEVGILYEQALQFAASDRSAPKLQIQERIALTRVAEGRRDVAYALWTEIASAPAAQSDANEASVLRSVLFMGNMETERGDFASALQTYERAEKRVGASRRPMPGARGMVAHRLGLLHQERGALAEAEAAYRRCIAADDAEHGPAYPRATELAGRLGFMLLKQNRPTDAEPLIRRYLESVRAAERPDAETLATAGTAYAQVCLLLDRTEDARREVLSLLPVFDRLPRRGEPHVGRLWFELARADSLSNNYADAEREFQKALAIYEAAGLTHWEKLAETLDGLASVLITQNRPTEAARYLPRSVQIYDEKLAPDDSRWGKVLYGLARLHHATGQFAEAETSVRRALSHLLRTDGTQRDLVPRAYELLAASLAGQSRADEAEAVVRKALEFRQQDPRSTSLNRPVYDRLEDALRKIR